MVVFRLLVCPIVMSFLPCSCTQVHLEVNHAVPIMQLSSCSRTWPCMLRWSADCVLMQDVQPIRFVRLCVHFPVDETIFDCGNAWTDVCSVSTWMYAEIDRIRMDSIDTYVDWMDWMDWIRWIDAFIFPCSSAIHSIFSPTSIHQSLCACDQSSIHGSWLSRFPYVENCRHPKMRLIRSIVLLKFIVQRRWATVAFQFCIRWANS